MTRRRLERRRGRNKPRGAGGLLGAWTADARPEYRSSRGGRSTAPASTAAAAKTAEATAKKRFEEITLALRRSELTPAGYIETAFQFPEVERLDIHGFARNTWEAVKIEELQPGFDASAIEQYLLEKRGPGRYRFSVVVGPKAFAWRVYTLGDVREELPANGHANGDGTALTTDAALREVTKHLQATLTTTQLSGMLADLETARTNRELGPAKLLIDMVGQVLNRTNAPAPANDRLTDLLIQELKDLKQEVREARAGGAAKPAESANASVVRIAEDIKALMAAGELLGLKPANGAAAAAPASPWTPDAVKALVEAASPVVGRVMDLVDLKLSGAVRAPTPPGGTAMEPSRTPVPPALAAALEQQKENIAFFLESLRSKDFPTVHWMLQNVFVDETNAPIVQIDPDVNPLAYVLKLKPFAPAINDLRGEIAEFLKWVRDQRTPAPPETT